MRKCHYCGHYVLPLSPFALHTPRGRVVCAPCADHALDTVIDLASLPARKLGALLAALRDNGEGPGAALANLIIGGTPPWESSR